MSGRLVLRTVASVLFLAATFVTAAQNEDTEGVSPGADDILVNFLNENSRDPTEYVVSKFKSKRIVLLGEVHQVSDTCDFVASLIEPLNEAGVKRLCSEFTPSRFNDQLREIVTGEEYNRASVIEIFRQAAWPTWGYQEYMNIIQAAWVVNHKRTGGEPPFLIVGIDSDWNQVDLMEATPQERFKIVVGREKHMTETIRHEVEEQQQKVLVHIGFAHTVRHGIRVANELSKKHSAEMFQVVMHHAIRTQTGISGITGVIERAAEKCEKNRHGFDVIGTPFSELRDEKIPFAQASGREPTLDFLAEGYVFLKPLDQLSKVTWVKGFITTKNFEDAQVIARELYKSGDEPKNPQELDHFFAQKFPGKN